MNNKISKIKLQNSYGETITLDLPTMDEAMVAVKEVGEEMIQMGISAREMTNAIKQLQEVMAQTNWAMHQIDEIQKDIANLTCETKSQECHLKSRAAALEEQLDNLRSALDAKPENPNQKGDLEISNQIIPSEDFLKLEGNMFLN